SLAVGPEPGEVAALADDREPLGEVMGEDDVEGHEGGGLVGRVPEHHPLVARAARVDAPRDIGRLPVDRGDYGAGLRVEAEVRVGVADGGDGAPHDVGDVDVG